MHDACHGFVDRALDGDERAPAPGRGARRQARSQGLLPDGPLPPRARAVRSISATTLEVANTLAGLTTYRPKLARRHASCGPACCRRARRPHPRSRTSRAAGSISRLAQLAAKYGAIYTRYADDLTFSFATARPRSASAASCGGSTRSASSEGFLERPDKRRILRSKHQQRVTGIVVNAGVHVPRADRKRFRAILHNCKKHGVASQAKGREDFDGVPRAATPRTCTWSSPTLGKKLVAEVARSLGEPPWLT